MADKLSADARAEALQSLIHWRFDATKDAISRQYRFHDFSEAFAFMTRVALLAEKANHHPDWSNSYAIVTISLSTHDAGGLSQKDIDLARAIDKIIP
ncbi:MAG: 4a-hydroxytetrahydrobiopterin dehydratase [Phyllobacteriaceae bacterium]|nr:4a-hydroxytetrahydrobiopterin dehydratase [Phyllobacteriaceae bacterium]